MRGVRIIGRAAALATLLAVFAANAAPAGETRFHRSGGVFEKAKQLIVAMFSRLGTPPG